MRMEIKAIRSIKSPGNILAISAVAAFIALSMLSSDLSAATIGVELTGQQYNSGLLTATASAGLTGYESTNYNVFNGDANSDGALDAQLSSATLNNGSGVATSATITTTGFTNVLLTGSPSNTPNTMLYKHGFSLATGAATPGTISVSGLAASGFGTYDLNIFLSKDVFTGGTSSVNTTLTINGTAIPIRINAYPDNSPFTFQDATVVSASNANGNANYVRLTGLTGNLTISLASTTQPVSIDGFQIISAVPEPSTYAMMLGGFGSLVWILRRRVRHS